MFPEQNRGYANNLTRLLNKIERRLGTAPLKLPDYLCKDKWDYVIIEDTLQTFSRYFPNRFRYTLTAEFNKDKRSSAYIIDESVIPGNVEIIGVRDFAWDNNFVMGGGWMNQGVYGYQDWYSNAFSLPDVGLVQAAADQVSLFDNNLFVEFKPPNKVFLSNCYRMPVLLPEFQVDLLITHSPDLSTIEPTKMNLFEDLATADVARFLYEQLKYYDGLELVFANIDIRLGDLQEAASRREEVISRLEEGYVSAANTNQPLIYTV